MRIVITGASGYLGQALVPHMHNHEVIALSSRAQRSKSGESWVCHDLESVADAKRFLERLDGDAVINLAAVNPGDGDARMARINAHWPGELARQCRKRNIRLVHVSTDMVHNGKASPYDDNALPSAVSEYGVTKAEGEARVLDAAPSAVCVRTSLIYGLRRIDRGTASFVSRIEAGEPLALFTDVLRQPVFDEDLAATLAMLATTHTQVDGRLNYAGDHVIDRDAFGRKMLAYWGYQTDRVHSVRAEEVAPSVPRDVRLVLARAVQLGFCVRGVNDVLAQLT